MAVRTYALEQLTALELDPLAFVDVAAKAGYDAIGLHLESLPVPHAAPYSLVSDPGLFAALVRRIGEAGLRVHVIEPFLIGPETSREVLLRNLDLGVRLGAAVAGTLSFDPEPSRGAERVAQLAEDAGERGIALTIEPYLESSWRTLSAAAAAAEAAGDNAGITLDVLHVVRGGEHWDAVSRLSPATIRAIQLSDGPLRQPDDWPMAAVTDRAVPGDGEFDLAKLIPLLPSGVPIGIEVPSLNLAQRMPADLRVRHLLERTQALFAAAP